MVVPTGSLSLPLYYDRESLANSANFQTWTGTVGDVAAARLRVHYGMAPGDATAPLAIVAPSEDFGRRRDGSGHWVYREGSGVELTFRAAKDPAHTIQEALIQFQNDIDTVLSDLESSSETGDRLSFNEWNYIEGPYIYDAESDDGQVLGEYCESRFMQMLEGI